MIEPTMQQAHARVVHAERAVIRAAKRLAKLTYKACDKIKSGATYSQEDHKPVVNASEGFLAAVCRLERAEKGARNA